MFRHRNISILSAVFIILSVVLAGCFGSTQQFADVTGTVSFESDGSPVVGADVRIGSKSSTTDADGTFVIERVPHGDHEITVHLGNVNVYSDGVKVSNSTSILEIVVEGDYDFAVVIGEVVRDSGRPIAGATVSLAGHETVTDADGSFSFDQVIYGEHVVTVTIYSHDYERPLDVNAPNISDVIIEISPHNVALHKPTKTSSVFRDYIGAGAVDGIVDDRDSRWLSASGAEPPHWLEIDLEGTFELVRAEVWTGNADGRDRHVLEQFRLEYWDGVDWAVIPGAEVDDNDVERAELDFTTPIITDKVRFVSDVDPEPVDGVRVIRVVEIMIYGIPSAK